MKNKINSLITSATTIVVIGTIMPIVIPTLLSIFLLKQQAKSKKEL